MNVKQIIVARRDLNMSPGKLAAQVAHASMGAAFSHGTIHEHTHQFLTHQRSFSIDLSKNPVLDEWLFKGSFTKVVLGVDTEDRLVEIYNQAILRNLPVVLIEDNGRTEFGGQQTKTCVGIGPLEAESFVGLTHHLKLY